MTRVLMVNRLGQTGGAARAARRLQLGLKRQGADAVLLVDAEAGDGAVPRRSALARSLGRRRSSIDQWPLRLSGHRPTTRWSVGWFPSRIAGEIRAFAADIVHLHWVGGGQLPLPSFGALPQPVVWTLHDMWAMTGGCHYDADCGGYRDRCGRCPQLGSTRPRDLSRLLWRAKHRLWRNFTPTIVCPSRWLADCVRASSLLGKLRVEVIPNGLDLEVYRPLERAAARRALDLPLGNRLLLFGAMGATSDPRKGFQHLAAALARLPRRLREQATVVVIGAEPPRDPPHFEIPTRYMGSISDESTLARLYAAADLTLVPSTQDNLPNMVMESLACGTPVAAFGIGGVPDMVDHERSGYIAAPFDADDLARGIGWVLSDDTRHSRLSEAAAAKARICFSAERVGDLHLELYRELLGQRSATHPGTQGRLRPSAISP